MKVKRVSGDNKKIDTGELEHRITMNLRSIQAPETGVDFDEKLSNQTSLWAMIKSINPVEIISGSNIEGVATHLIGIRYRNGVTTQNWIMHDNKVYKILSTDDGVSSNKTFLFMYCCLKGTVDNPVNYV